MHLDSIHQGACQDLIPLLADQSVDLVLTSPPYAMQRAGLYASVPEADYPAWLAGIMTTLKPKMTPAGNVLIVIRAGVKNGTLSDYVLHTRLAIRASGWVECEELIWLKTDAPPMGSTLRPRRTWENILWFSPTNRPFTDLTACGNPKSTRIGFAGSDRFGEGGTSPVHAGQNRDLKAGTSKVADHFVAHVGQIEKGVSHPAMYPQTLCDKLIRTFSPVGGLVLDPFVGSGQTALAAITAGRKYIGFDTDPDYVRLTTQRIEGHGLFSQNANAQRTDQNRLHDGPEPPSERTPGGESVPAGGDRNH